MSERESQLAPTDLLALPVFPLPNVVLFPGALLPFRVFEPRYTDMTRDTLSGPRLLVIARLRVGFEGDYYGRPPFHRVCGLGKIVRHQEHADGCYDILVSGLARVIVEEELPVSRSYRLVRAQRLSDDRPRDPLAISAWQKELGRLSEKLSPYLPASLRELCRGWRGTNEPGAWADRLAAALVVEPDERQLLLEELDPGERLCRLVERLYELSEALELSSATGAELN